MSWGDKPTYSQLQVIYSWLSWEMPREKAVKASKYLEDHATRKEVSEEMKRLKALKDQRKLDKDNCFESNVWNNFEFVEGK